VLANIGGFWDPLLSLFALMREESFIRHGLELHLEVVEGVDAIIPAITRALIPRDETAEAEAEAKVTAKF
jgi:predicted Rossmann-fold nucleotide-binding protein